MIPNFPEFKKLDLSDKDYINKFSAKYKQYADFNFTNLWSWNTLETRKISNLNDNLVILISDYRTNDLSLSYLGENLPNETSKILLEAVNNHNLGNGQLVYIPEEIASTLDENIFNINEDTINNDYIFSVKELSDLNGNKFKSKRHAVHRFVKNHTEIELTHSSTCTEQEQLEIFNLMETWAANKQSSGKNYELVYETLALNRLLRTADQHNLVITIVRIDKSLAGFGIDEILADNHAISHFIKADTKYQGIYEFLNKKIAEYMHTQGVEFWNWEQDLGIDALKEIKSSYRPIQYLKKYKVTLR